MKIYKIILLSLSVFCKEILSLNILGVFPYEGKSHFFVFKPYLEELARRGHNLTVVSHFPQKRPLQNYTDISLADKSEILEDVFPIHRSYWVIMNVIWFLNSAGNKNCKMLLEDENVQQLWKTQSTFDVVITEQFNSDCALGLAYKLGAPVVGITSNIMMPWHFEPFGIAFNPSYVSGMFLEGGTKPTVYQRIERTILNGITSFAYKYIVQRNDQQTLAKYFDDIPPLEDLARDIKFMLLYRHFVLNGAMLYPPNVIEVGGYHVAKPKSLPEDVKKFIEESEHGVIYISFGSMLKPTSLPQEKIDAILGVISKLPQRIIWKLDDKNVLGDVKNAYLSSWLPQNDILAHPNVLAFYSHGGLLSATEAIYHGVPIICMPVFGDQPANAAAVEESGLGVQIQINELTTPILSEKFKTVLNPQFNAKVKELSKIWHDRPMSAMDSAIYWTEFAARTSNYTFRSAASTVPNYQYFYLDILAVFATGAVVVLFLIMWLFKKPKQTKNKLKTK